MIRLRNWTDFKTFVNDRQLSIQWFDTDGHYYLAAIDGPFTVHHTMQKDGGADELDFVNNYKSAGNQKIDLGGLPFSAKKINGKKLFQRAHGESYSLTSGLNTIEFHIPYNEVKFNEIEIINAEVGDNCKLKILDTATGTYTGQPNYELNQFGYDVNLGPGFYRRGSKYDADLNLGMRIVVEYSSVSAKSVYINYILHELKA